MDRVMRATEDLKNKQLMEKEEQILARMRNYKDFDDNLIDLTRRPKRTKKGDKIVDMRYEDIELIFADMENAPAPVIDKEKEEAIESEARRKEAEDTRRLKETYLKEEYSEAAARARNHRKKMIELLEARGIGIDESVEL